MYLIISLNVSAILELDEILRASVRWPVENMVGVNMVLALYHRICIIHA